MRAARAFGGRYGPHPPPVRVPPFRRRVGLAGVPIRVLREARLAAEVARPARGRRRVLPLEGRLRLVDAPVRVSTLVDCLLPLPQVAPGRPAA